MVTQEVQLGAEAVDFIDEIEHGFEQRQFEAMNGSHVVDAPDGVNRFLREFHHPIRRPKDRSNKTGATVDQYGSTGDTGEMSGGVETIEDVRLGLEQLQGGDGEDPGCGACS